MLFLVKVPGSHLTWVFFRLIRIAISIAAIKDINLNNWNEALSSLFLISVVAIFFFLFSGLYVSFF